MSRVETVVIQAVDILRVDENAADPNMVTDISNRTGRDVPPIVHRKSKKDDL
jgi:hypothetical protein